MAIGEHRATGPHPKGRNGMEGGAARSFLSREEAARRRQPSTAGKKVGNALLRDRGRAASRTRCEIRQQERPQWTHLTRLHGEEGRGSRCQKSGRERLAEVRRYLASRPAVQPLTQTRRKANLRLYSCESAYLRMATEPRGTSWECQCSASRTIHLVIAAVSGGEECRPPSSTGARLRDAALKELISLKQVIRKRKKV